MFLSKKKNPIPMLLVFIRRVIYLDMRKSNPFLLPPKEGDKKINTCKEIKN